MRTKPYVGWSIAYPAWDGELQLSGTVFATRQEAIREQCWGFGEVEADSRYCGPWPWLAPSSEDVSRAWRRLRRRGHRAIRVEVRPLVDAMTSEEVGHG